MRFGVALLLNPAGRFPLATLSANVIGCFIAGILGTWLMARASVSPEIQLFLITGVLGGFTTFSAFSLDTLRLAESGQWSWALVNVLANVIGTLLAVVSGWWLTRAFLL
ncbi:UNVERIFIED_CONTAM: hypothetical protein GTU68_011751 [Idotea baltica]|nr:hypothetical protein [Idotea baltica]